MSVLDSWRATADVEVDACNSFSPAGYESPAEALPRSGDRAAAFAELFDTEWLIPEWDESDQFTGGMPISTVLIVLDAVVDDRIETGSGLRAWAVADTIHTVLPMTAGLALMPDLPTGAKPRHRLVSSELIGQTGRGRGCVSVPNIPTSMARRPATHA